MMYRIIFHLNPESEALLNELQIDHTKQTIDTNDYLTVIKYCKELSLKLNDDILCSNLLGNELNEFLDYTERVI
jgi:hypothetical protein